MRGKITVVGAGNVGATLAHRLVERGDTDVVLLDIVEGLPQGKALDLLEAGPVLGYDSQIVGTNDYADTASSDIVIITSGVPRKPGMSRDDLVITNAKIVASVSESVAKASPNAIVIVVSNPLDAMAQICRAVTGFPKERVIGMAGILDTARFRTFISQELHTSVRGVEAYVLGGHGDTMVPVTGMTTVAGVPVSQLIKADRLDAIVQRTRNGGAEIVDLLKTGSAFYAPSAAVAQMVNAILRDTREILPCSAYLEGEFGITGLFTGVPCELGKGGLKRVVEISLSVDEKTALHKSAASVRELVEIIDTNKDQIYPQLPQLSDRVAVG